jgi:hypothetical protein
MNVADHLFQFLGALFPVGTPLIQPVRKRRSRDTTSKADQAANDNWYKRFHFTSRFPHCPFAMQKALWLNLLT